MMERVKLTATAKNQLVTLKRRTGIEHNNAICRHALCISLANPSVPPEENFVYSGGLEIEWRTFTGGQDELYTNLLIVRLLSEGKTITEDAIRSMLQLHVHRGLSYLMSQRDDDLLVALAAGMAEQ